MANRRRVNSADDGAAVPPASKTVTTDDRVIRGDYFQVGVCRPGLVLLAGRPEPTFFQGRGDLRGGGPWPPDAFMGRPPVSQTTS